MDALLGELLKLGPMGIVIAFMALAIRRQDARNEKLTEALMGVSVKYAELSSNVTNSLDNLTDSIRGKGN